MKREVIEFGQIKVTVEQPHTSHVIVDLACHSQNADEFRGTVEAAGGLAAFDPVRTDRSWIDAHVEVGGRAHELTVFVPSDLIPRPVGDPCWERSAGWRSWSERADCSTVMAVLRDEQDAARDSDDDVLMTDQQDRP